MFTISLSLVLKMGQAWPNSVSLWVWEGKEKRGWQCGTNQGPLENGTVGGRTHNGGCLGKGCRLGTFYRHHLNPCSNSPGTTLGSDGRESSTGKMGNGQWCTDLYSCLSLWFSDSESLGQFSDNGNMFHGSMRSGLPVACLSSYSAQSPWFFSMAHPGRLRCTSRPSVPWTLSRLPLLMAPAFLLF